MCGSKVESGGEEPFPWPPASIPTIQEVRDRAVSHYECKKDVYIHTLSYDDIRSDLFYGDLGFLLAPYSDEQLPRILYAIPV
jgi:hypothetical protein